MGFSRGVPLLNTFLKGIRCFRWRTECRCFPVRSTVTHRKDWESFWEGDKKCYCPSLDLFLIFATRPTSTTCRWKFNFKQVDVVLQYHHNNDISYIFHFAFNCESFLRYLLLIFHTRRIQPLNQHALVCDLCMEPFCCQPCIVHTRFNSRFYTNTLTHTAFSPSFYSQDRKGAVWQGLSSGLGAGKRRVWDGVRRFSALRRVAGKRWLCFGGSTWPRLAPRSHIHMRVFLFLSLGCDKTRR